MSKQRRVLIAVGCDEYDSLQSLHGAEQDAANIFNLLTAPEHGDYPANESLLLRSPTLSELQSALRSSFSAKHPIETLTIFFAGHGSTCHGSYFLCLRDTTTALLSGTALSLAQLFTMINEVRPSQFNLIFDACQGGGLVLDVGVLLKPELIGSAHTPGISIFATAASDEYATDTSMGGVGTLALLKALSGAVPIQTQRPYLDLVEVGRATAKVLLDQGAAQTPVVWGLNLFGQSRFARNPNFVGGAPSSLVELAAIPTASIAGRKVTKHTDALWRTHYDLPKQFDSRAFATRIGLAATDLADEPSALANFLVGVSRTLADRAQTSTDPFTEIEVLASGIAGVLPLTGTAPTVDQAVDALSDELLARILPLLARLVDELSSNEYFLINHGSADFFYLPLRVTKLLGWIGATAHLTKLLGVPSATHDAALLSAVREITKHYAPALKAISETQCPYTLSFLMAAHSNEWTDEGELVFGCIFSDFINHKGKIASASRASDRVLEFLLARNAGPEAVPCDLTARPTELLSILLLMAERFALTEVVDPYLIAVDHLEFNSFIPDTHLDFALPSIESGLNHSFRIGHGVWNCAEFLQRWNDACVPALTSDTSLNNRSTKIAALLATMLFPDRTPWFLCVS